jgi:nucleoside-diphosphate-sugar epimerase
MSATVVVFGASSYVGSRTIRLLLESGYRIVAVSRRPDIARMLLADLDENLEAVALDNVVRDTTKADAVLNFAYITRASPHEIYQQNRRLIEAVAEVAKSSGARRVLHTSTVAVFGYDLAAGVKPAYVRWRSAGEYVETKILAEHELLRRVSPPIRLGIIRLGNVIGPGSRWTAGLAQRILEGKTVGYEDRDGFSNATYVENVADYIRRLVQEPEYKLDKFGAYHHLAEFSGRSWRELLERMATDMSGVAGLVLSHSTSPSSSATSSLTQLGKRAYRGRMGGYVRRMLGLFPHVEWLDTWTARARAYSPPGELRPRVSDRQVLETLSLPRRVQSHVIPGWEPPVTFVEACDTIGAWLKESGYTLAYGGHDQGSGRGGGPTDDDARGLA